MAITKKILSVLYACVKCEASYSFTQKAMELAAKTEKEVLSLYIEGYKAAVDSKDREYFMCKIKQFGDKK